MAKKICIVIIILSILSILSGISDLIEGIRERGFSGVNYGIIVFPALLAGWSFIMIKIKEK